MIYGIGFFAVVIGSIESFLASSDVYVEALKEKLDLVDSFAADS